MADHTAPVFSGNLEDEKTPLIQSKQQRNESSAVVDVTAVTASTKSSKASIWRRWISIYIMCFTIFLAAVNFSIVLSSLFPYLQKLSNKQASTSFLGWVVAAFSLGQLIASPIFGFWSDHRPPKEPVVISLLISLVAYLVYCYTEAFPVGSAQYVLVAARFVIGLAAGSSAVVRSYVSSASMEQERTGALAIVSASQAIGFVLGPVLGLAFVPLGDDGVYVSQLRFYFNMYTGPGYFAMLLILLNLVLVIFLFRDYRLPVLTSFQTVKQKTGKMSRIGLNTEKSDNESSEGGSVERGIQGEETATDIQRSYDRISAYVSLYLFFVICFVFAIFETIGTPYTMDEFAWSRTQAVFYNNIFLGSLSAISIFCYIGVKYISKIFDERLVFVIALILIAVGMFVNIPMGDGIAEIQMINSTVMTESSNATNTALDYGGCRYPQLKWCLTEPRLLLVQYLLGFLFISVGFAFSIVLCYSIYSKILGPFPQGMMMGILTAAGSLARMGGPMFVTYMYDSFGPQVTFATVDGIIATAILLLMIFYYRLVPYGQHWGF